MATVNTGRAARRQLVDHRDIEVAYAVIASVRGYRRRGHDELVRVAAFRSFLAQAHALVHAKAMLLVDDHERELPES